MRAAHWLKFKGLQVTISMKVGEGVESVIGVADRVTYKSIIINGWKTQTVGAIHLEPDLWVDVGDILSIEYTPRMRKL